MLAFDECRSCPVLPIQSIISPSLQRTAIYLPWVCSGHPIQVSIIAWTSRNYHSGSQTLNGSAVQADIAASQSIVFPFEVSFPSTRCTARPSTAEEAPTALADSQSHPSLPLPRFTGESQVAFSRSIHIRCRSSANARRVSTILSLDVCDRGSTGLGEARYANNGAVV